MQKVLIVGGTNKTAISVAKELQQNGYEIDTMTYRDKEKIVACPKDWSHLDLFDSYSIENFLKNQIGKKYNKIIFFISNSSKPYTKGLGFNTDSLKDFYGTFCVNYLILIKNLIQNLSDDGSIVYISSSSAETGATNITYSSAKALIQNYVLSLNNFLTDKQSACSILPTTIFESNFYNSLPEDSPIKLNNFNIVYPKDIANVINESYFYKGKKIKLGWDESWSI